MPGKQNRIINNLIYKYMNQVLLIAFTYLAWYIFNMPCKKRVYLKRWQKLKTHRPSFKLIGGTQGKQFSCVFSLGECVITRLSKKVFSACQNWEPANRIGDFGNFFNGFGKSPRVLRSSWILNECNLYCKIVKYCIMSEVCMIKTVPHSTVSPQMWCISDIKAWFTRTQICWQDFVK